MKNWTWILFDVETEDRKRYYLTGVSSPRTWKLKRGTKYERKYSTRKNKIITDVLFWYKWMCV